MKIEISGGTRNIFNQIQKDYNKGAKQRLKIYLWAIITQNILYWIEDKFIIN